MFGKQLGVRKVQNPFVTLNVFEANELNNTHKQVIVIEGCSFPGNYSNPIIHDCEHVYLIFKNCEFHGKQKGFFKNVRFVKIMFVNCTRERETDFEGMFDYCSIITLLRPIHEVKYPGELRFYQKTNKKLVYSLSDYVEGDDPTEDLENFIRACGCPADIKDYLRACDCDGLFHYWWLSREQLDECRETISKACEDCWKSQRELSERFKPIKIQRGGYPRQYKFYDFDKIMTSSLIQFARNFKEK